MLDSIWRKLGEMIAWVGSKVCGELCLGRSGHLRYGAPCKPWTQPQASVWVPEWAGAPHFSSLLPAWDKTQAWRLCLEF